MGETGASSTKNICYYGTWKTEAQCLTLCQTAYSNCGEDVAYGEATQAECNTEFDECKQDTCGVSADADGDQIPDAQDECPNDASNTCNDPVELGGVCTSDAHCVGDLECAGGVCALYTCEDSDGTVSGIDSGDGMTFVEKTDGCVGVAGGTPTNVIDWSCDAAGYVSSEITSCSDGEICTGAGVCVSEDIDGDGVLDSVDMCPNLQTSVKQHTAGSSLGCIFGDSDNTGCLKSQEFLSMKYYYLNTDEAATVSCSATNAPADCLQSNEFLALKYYYLNTDDPSTVACS